MPETPSPELPEPKTTAKYEIDHFIGNSLGPIIIAHEARLPRPAEFYDERIAKMVEGLRLIINRIETGEVTEDEKVNRAYIETLIGQAENLAPTDSRAVDNFYEAYQKHVG